MATQLETLKVSVTADTSEFNGKLNNLTREGGALSRIGSAAAVAAGIAAGAIAGISTAISGVIGKANELETSMAGVFQLLPGKSDEARKAMERDVRELARTYGLSAIEMSDGLALALSSGIPEENVFEFLEAAAQGAVASGEPVNDVVKDLAANYNVWSREGYSVQKILDKTNKTLDLGVGSYGETSSAIAEIGPTATTAGVSLEEVNAALATLTVNGIAMSEASTQVKRMLIEMNDSGSVAGKTFKEIAGVSFSEFTASGGTLAEALELLEGHADKTGKSVNEFFGMQTAGNAALILTGQGAEYNAQALNEMGDSAGTTLRKYEEMAATQGQANARMRAAMSETVLKMGDEMRPAQEAMRELVMRVWPAIEGVVVPVMGAIADSIVYVVDVVIPALVAGFNDTSETSNLFTVIGSVIGAAFEVIRSAFRLGVTAWESILKPVWLAIRPMVEFQFNALFAVVQRVFDSIRGVFQMVGQLLRGDWAGAWQTYKDLTVGNVEAAWTLVEGYFTAAVQTLTNILNPFLDNIKTAWSTTRDAVAAAVNGIETAVTLAFTAFTSAAKTTWDNFEAALTGGFNAFKTVATTVFNGLKGSVTGTFDALFAALTSGWSGFATTITGIVSAIVGGVTGAFDGLVGAVAGAWGSISSTISEAVKGIVGDIKGLFQNAVDGVASIFKGLVNAVKEPINSAIDLVNGFISDFNAFEVTVPEFTIPGVSFDVPDWVPGIGGGTQGFGPWTIGGQSFSTPDLPTIPHLADGGIVTAPTLAMVGEGGESEAVIPLSKLESVTGGTGHTINVHLDGRVIARTTVQHMPSVLDIHGVGY